MKRQICLFLVFLALCAVAATMDSTKINPTQLGFSAGSLYIKTGSEITNTILTGPTTNHGTLVIDQSSTINALIINTNNFVITNGMIGIGTATPNYAIKMTKPPVNQAGFGYLPTSVTAGDFLFYIEAPAVDNIFPLYFTAPATNDVSISFRNTKASLTGRTILELSTSGATGGDPAILYTISGVLNWIVGIDNSDGDKYKIAVNSLLGTSSDSFTITPGGNVGIGTTTPATMLHVLQTGTFANLIAQTNITVTNLTTTGSLKVGPGTIITNIVSATAALDFGSILAAGSADLTITVAGAKANDSVAGGAPVDPDGSLTFDYFVSAANTVTVRAHNVGTIAVDQASKTWRVTVSQF